MSSLSLGQLTVPSETLYFLAIFSISIIKASISCNHTQFSRHLHRIMVSTRQIQPPRRSHRRPSSARAIGGSTPEKSTSRSRSRPQQRSAKSAPRSKQATPMETVDCHTESPDVHKPPANKAPKLSPQLLLAIIVSHKQPVINQYACIKRITIVLQSVWLWKPRKSAIGPVGRRYSSPGVVGLQP